MRSRFRRLAAAAGVATMVALAPCAAADLPDPANTSTIALSNLGSSDTITFDTRRQNTGTRVSFTVPKGQTPASLNATMELPVKMRAGSLVVTQDGRTVSRQDIPSGDEAAVSIPLAGVEVNGGWTTILITVTALPEEDSYCWDPAAPIRLVDSSVTFSGSPATPRTVAEFLPIALGKLTIGIPMKPSAAESGAAIQLAAAMAARYGWQKTDIVVVPISGGADTLPPPVPRERQIWLKEGSDRGLTLLPRPGAPVLLISGPGDELTNQTRLLTDPTGDYALSTKAVADDLTPEPQPTLTSATLEQAMKKPKDSEDLRPNVRISIDQTVFGQPLAGIRVHVLGSYTPLPSHFSGEFIAQIDGEAIDRWPVDAGGEIDRWIDIPNHLTDRTTALTIMEHTAGDPGDCNNFLNFALRIDPTSEIRANRASPPTPPGFRSFPQSLMPTVEVGVEPGNAVDVARAAKIIVGLQRSSAVPLTTEVTSLRDAIAGGKSAVLVSPNGWTDESIALPFTSKLGRITIDGLAPGDKPAKLTLEPPVKFASLQTIYDGQRSLLIATSNGAAAQLDELLRWLAEQPNRWPDLDGRAIISVPYNAPVTVPNSKADLAVDQASGASVLGKSGWPWLVATVIAAGALVGAGVILFRSRKPRSVAAGQPEQPDTDRPVTAPTDEA